MKGLGAALQQKVVVQRDTMELQQQMKSLEGMSDAEKIMKLKEMINRQTLKNKQMITKSLKLKSETEKTFKLIKDAETTKPVEQKPAPKKEVDVADEFRKMISGDTLIRPKPSKLPVSGQRKKEEVKFCACGTPNPTHNGYCTDCVAKLKKRYDELL